MDIVSRAKNICLTPAVEWPVIAEEQTSTSDLVTGYVAPLAAIGAVAGFIGGSIIGQSVPFVGYFRVPITTGLGAAIFSFVMAVVGVFVIAFIIDALAPTFGGQKNSAQALKVAAYSYTPAWVAGALRILPFLGLLGVLLGLYGLYLLYLGLPRLMRCPADKAAGYTVVVVICAIVLFMIVGSISGAVLGAGMVGTRFGSAALGSAMGSPAGSEVQFDKNSALGKLQDLSHRLDETNKKIDAAARSGDANAQVAAALEGLGTLAGGGKRVDPVNVDTLTAFMPDSFAGLRKTSSGGDKNGIAGLMVSKAEATYGDAGKTVTLQISDSGGVSGLVGLVGWVGVQDQRDDSTGSERTEKINGRLTHEKTSKLGGDNEYGIVLGDRFIVAAKGRVEVSALKAAVSGLDLGRLEAMKDQGTEE
jgi:hypothetical protein